MATFEETLQWNGNGWLHCLQFFKTGYRLQKLFWRIEPWYWSTTIFFFEKLVYKYNFSFIKLHLLIKIKKAHANFHGIIGQPFWGSILCIVIEKLNILKCVLTTTLQSDPIFILGSEKFKEKYWCEGSKLLFKYVRTDMKGKYNFGRKYLNWKVNWCLASPLYTVHINAFLLCLTF